MKMYKLITVFSLAMIAHGYVSGTDLFTAVEWHDIDEVKRIIKRTDGAELEKKDDTFGETALMLAAKEGHKGSCEIAIVENGADVNAKSSSGVMKRSSGDTALMLAASGGHKDVMELLIEHHADVNAKDSGGWTALVRAAGNGNKDVAKWLIEKGADVNANNLEH